jgi:hypothetical protein
MSKKKIEKFNDFEYKPLSDDSANIELEVDGKVEDIKEWEIESILDVHHEKEEVSENAISLHSDLSSKPTKRGDIIWITALVRKNNTSFNNPSQQAVIKARIVDMYFGTSGLSHLNKALAKR